MSLRDLTEQALLRQIAPTGALVNGHGDILYLHGRTGMYLEPAPGEAGVNNILKMAREGLRGELTTALHKAAGTREQVRRTGLLVKTNGDFTPTNLTVCPLAARPDSSRSGGGMADPAATLSASLYLVILEEGASFDPGQAPLAAAGDDKEGAADPDTLVRDPGQCPNRCAEAGAPGQGGISPDRQRGTQIHQRGNAVGQRGTAIHQ